MGLSFLLSREPKYIQVLSPVIQIEKWNKCTVETKELNYNEEAHLQTLKNTQEPKNEARD